MSEVTSAADDNVEQRNQFEQDLSEKISAFLGGKLDLLAVESDDE